MDAHVTVTYLLYIRILIISQQRVVYVRFLWRRSVSRPYLSLYICMCMYIVYYGFFIYNYMILIIVVTR